MVTGVRKLVEDIESQFFNARKDTAVLRILPIIGFLSTEKRDAKKRRITEFRG